LVTGGIALKLVERKELSTHKASVILSVYQSIMWLSTPLQAIVDAHDMGHKGEQKSGILYFL